MADYVCDICSRTFSRDRITFHSAETVQQAIREGFNPWKNSAIDMSAVSALTGFFGLGTEELYGDWRRRAMSDVTDWGLCPSCSQAIDGGTQVAQPVQRDDIAHQGVQDPALASRIRELVAAGETFEATKVYAKATGKGPREAREYVDDLAKRAREAQGGSVRAERHEVTVAGKSLEEAMEKVRALVPEGGVLLSSKIVNKGERRITRSGSTVDEAFAKTERQLSAEEKVLRRRVISEPVSRTVVVHASDPDDAAGRVKQTLAKGERVLHVTELTSGSEPTVGVGTSTNEYTVSVLEKKAIAEIVCSCQAEVRAVITGPASSEPPTAEGTTGSGPRVAVAPDWYQDPVGRHQWRYWDGTSWTDHVADNGEVNVDPLA